ncbi:MAG: oligosaccharide flippase family protein [Acaryochloridaceae cyanobacterium SU_2_1]|nr:oligosaccharide flippase family protein [Acaryochloridaceae cyanobacterium SU_2_1]
MSSFKKLLIRGTLWTLLGYGGGQVLRFAGNLILTRLLFPDLFGLMALTHIFVIGLELFSDLGLNWSVIQNKRGDDPVFLNTAWTVDVLRGCLLWLGCWCIAWPVAQLYGYPDLAWLIPLVGLSTIFSGFKSTAIATLERHLKVKEQVFFELTSQAIGLTVMVVWAYLSPGILALALGGLTTSFIKMVWSHYLIPGPKNKFAWEKESLTELLTLGRWIFFSTALTFLAEQTDRLMLGSIFPLGLLGVYGIALTLSDLPYQVMMSISNKVIFPAINKNIDQPQDLLFAKILRNRQPFLWASIALILGLVSCGDLLIKTLYDQRYLEATWMLPLLALGIWPRLLSQINEPYLCALGKFQYLTLGNFSRLVFTVLGIWLGSKYFGHPGAVIGIALNDLFYYLVINYGLWRQGLNALWQDGLATGLLLGLILLVCLLRIQLGLDLPIALLWTKPS